MSMENIFDKDITIINKYSDKESKTVKYKVSHVKGFWSSNDGVSINGVQLTKSDGLSARILIHDSRNAIYQEPQNFKKEQRTWTLQTDDYLVKGIVNDFTTIIKLLEEHKEIMKITDIAVKDYGSEDMQHFVIKGA